MSAALEELDTRITTIVEKLEDLNNWPLDMPNPYNKICPDCYASIPQLGVEPHIGWHRSQYAQLQAIMAGFDSLGALGDLLTE